MLSSNSQVPNLNPDHPKVSNEKNILEKKIITKVINNKKLSLLTIVQFLQKHHGVKINHKPIGTENATPQNSKGCQKPQGVSSVELSGVLLSKDGL